MRRGWEGGELSSSDVGAAAGTAQPAQANKNATYLYTAGRCFILLDPHRPGWLPWRQGKTPLWGRWILGTQREWSASPPHKRLRPPGDFASPAPSLLLPARSPHSLGVRSRGGSTCVTSPAASHGDLAGTVPPEALQSASKHQAPRSGCWDAKNPAQSRVTSTPGPKQTRRGPPTARCQRTAARTGTAGGASLPPLPPPLLQPPHQPGSWQPLPRLPGPGMDLNFR